MDSKLEPDKIYKHPQCEKILKEVDEDSWISGEELRTDGSSDEGNTEKSNKAKIKKKHKHEHSHTQSIQKSQDTQQADEASNSKAPKSDDFSNQWRPKRGSLTLPNLYEERKFQAQIDFLKEIAEKVNSLEYLKLDELNDEDVEEPSKSKGENDAKIKAMFIKIEELENQIRDEMSLLQMEKEDRLRTQEEVCQEIYRDNKYYNRSSETFLNICHFEDTEQQSEESDDARQVCDSDEKKCSKLNPRKNFIRKNIELAAKAMSSQPLTDEEKEKLQLLLLDTELSETENRSESIENSKMDESSDEDEFDLKDEKDLSNAFQVTDEDRRRIGEIDLKLNDFTETQFLKRQNDDNEHHWRNLVPDQALKDIDKKLAGIDEVYRKDDESSEEN